MIVPSVIGAISMYFSFAQVDLDYSYTALVIAHTAMAAPIVVVTVSAVLARFERNLLPAAASLVAHPLPGVPARHAAADHARRRVGRNLRLRQAGARAGEGGGARLIRTG
jgi:hypothetical protein